MTVTELLKNYVLLDGATGTELQKRGLPLGSCSELWNLAHPEAIMDLQRSYVNAGSQIVYAPNCHPRNLNAIWWRYRAGTAR